MTSLKKRPCGPVKSAKNPTALTKDELVTMAVKKFNITKSKAMSMTKPALCTSLISGKLGEVSPVKKSKSKSPVRSRSPKKTTKTAVKSKSPKKLTKPAKSKSPKKAAAKSVKPKSPKKTTLKSTKSKSPKKLKPKSQVISPESSESEDEKDESEDRENVGNCVERSKLPLQGHQKAIVDHLRKNRGLIVAHEVGSGKTLAAVTASQCFLEDNPTGKIIVVTPLSLQENFKKELGVYGVSKKQMTSYKFYTLQKFATEYGDKKCGGGKHPVMLIIDEAHNLRTPVKVRKTSKKAKSRSEVAVECAKTVDKVLLLTATAIYNEPRDIANLVAMVKGIDPPTKKNFENIISSPYTFEKFFSCVISFYKVPKDENYPSSKEHYVEIPMTASYYKKYMEIENVLGGIKYFDEKDKEWKYKPSEGEEPDPWVFLTGLRKASNKFEDDCIKCDWVLKKVKKAVKRGNKTVIYSFFLDYGVKQLQKLFDENNIPWVEVTGKSAAKERSNAVKTYNENSVDVLFITKAGGEGLDLKGTRNVIVFEGSWNKATDDQVIGRAIRYKSHTHLSKKKQKVDIYHLLIVKPQGVPDKYNSADVMMRTLATKKELENSSFLKKLEMLSIEKNLKC